MAAPFWRLGPWELYFGRFCIWSFILAISGPGSCILGASFCLFVAFHRPCRMGQWGILMAFQGRSRFATRCMTFISSSWLPFLSLCDGSPDLQDGQPISPETVGDAARVSHTPAPVLHRGGLSVGPRPTEHVQHIAPGTDAQQPDVHSKNKELGIQTALRTVQIPLLPRSKKIIIKHAQDVPIADAVAQTPAANRR